MARETILVTGASRGIGAAAAASLARPGRRLILLARGRDALEATALAIERRGAEAHVAPADLADPEQTRSCLEALEDAFGPMDGLVLNAGIANHLLFEETSLDLMTREMTVNYFAPTELLRRALPEMRRRGQGRAMVVGSLTCLVPFPGNASYSASKGALFSLVRSLRCELRGSGVFLGITLPGLTRTRLAEAYDSPLPSMTAETVGRAVAEGYEHRRALVIPGLANAVGARLFGAFPSFSEQLVGGLAHWLPRRRA
jgi:short-subunit dehydrogenase